MWIGNLISFAPAVVMFWPAYFSGHAAKWYGVTWSWAEKAGGVANMLTMIMFIIEAINTGTGQTATKSIWLSIWLFVVSNIVAAGLLMNFGEDAKLWYIWPMLEAIKKMKEDGGDEIENDETVDTNDELDDSATELFANYF